jgi:hypothetical protein
VVGVEKNMRGGAGGEYRWDGEKKDVKKMRRRRGRGKVKRIKVKQIIWMREEDLKKITMCRPRRGGGEGRIGVYRNGELYKPKLYSSRLMSIAIAIESSHSVSSESGGRRRLIVAGACPC